MSDKVEIDLEDLDDLKDFIGDERKKADFSFQKVFFPFGVQLAVLDEDNSIRPFSGNDSSCHPDVCLFIGLL